MRVNSPASCPHFREVFNRMGVYDLGLPRGTLLEERTTRGVSLSSRGRIPRENPLYLHSLLPTCNVRGRSISSTTTASADHDDDSQQIEHIRYHQRQRASTTTTISSQLRYRVPDDDVCGYLVGTWKRGLEWREFGPGFQHVRTRYERMGGVRRR